MAQACQELSEHTSGSKSLETQADHTRLLVAETLAAATFEFNLQDKTDTTTEDENWAISSRPIKS